MDSMMKATVVIFLVIVLLVSIFNMIRLGTIRSNASYVPVCEQRSINLVNHDTDTQSDASTRGHTLPSNDHLVYRTKSVEPISSVL